MLHANQRVTAFEAWKNTPAGRLIRTDYSDGESDGLRQAASYLSSGLTNETNETRVSEQ